MSTPDDDRAELAGADWLTLPVPPVEHGPCGCPTGAPITDACFIAALDAIGKGTP